MKLLLTSDGITNESIKKALQDLCVRPFGELKLAFIPTAANVEDGDKDWLIKDISYGMKLGFAETDIVDISAIDAEMAERRLENADVLMFGGGNTFHLMYWLQKSGLKQQIPELLKTRVYVGISAGSMVATANLVLSDSPRLYNNEKIGADATQGLGLVDFHIRPHLNSLHFPAMSVENVEKISKEVTEPVYAIDDTTAIRVVDRDMQIISEGMWKRFN
ncbi:Type 1 glutamine amidotransferase-like domain-containing protein [Candidatus Microgenomates bacterium]|nr:Type 1 glutamine amidotransferase-like domain-containing protein [Candidatus Microgenomates bacterium]